MNTPKQQSNDLPSLQLISNVISGNRYLTDLKASAAEIAQVLRAHCGPFATAAVIPTRISRDDPSLVVDRFTNDGISIAKLLNTNDVMTAYLLRMVVHVGEKVDAACHDGTTTSMLMMLNLMTQLSGVIKDGGHLDVTLPEWKSSIARTIEIAREIIEHQAITPAELVAFCQELGVTATADDIRYSLAYHEALLSSKGDVELADGIAQVVSSLPTEMFGYYEIENTPKETDKKYVVQQRLYDFQLGGNIKPTFYNHKLNTELKLDSCDIMVSDRDPVTGSPLTNALVVMMLADPEFKAYAEENAPSVFKALEATGILSEMEFIQPVRPDFLSRPLVVMAPMWFTCPHLDRLVSMWNSLYPDKKIIDAQIQPDPILRQAYASGISAVAGKRPIERLDLLGDSLEDAVIRDAAIQATTRTIRMSNLYHKTGDLFHPFYTDKTSNPFYTETLETIHELISADDDAHVSEFSEMQKKSLISLYRGMTCQRIADLQTGGSTHTAVASRDVVTDAYGSALSAIEDGVVLGGYPKLKMFFANLAANDPDLAPHKRSLYWGWVQAIDSLVTAIYRTEPNSDYGTDDTPYGYTLPDGEGVLVHKNLKQQLDNFLLPARTRELTDSHRLGELKKEDRRILFQPVVGYRELFRLLSGILPNLLSSDKLVVVA